MYEIYHILDLSFILTLIQMIPMLVMIWIGVVAAWGLLKKRRMEPVALRKKPLRFGIIVCAHNEEAAIRSLFESIEAQDYDHESIRVFLLADHCTDNTTAIGKEYPFVVVMERKDGPQTGKGAVLQWGLEQILHSDAGDRVEAFAVIDADNVLREDFLRKMDRKLREGAEIVQGNRLGGQPYRSVITKWYTMYWACYTVFFSYVREKAGLSCFLTGTGFAVTASLLRDEGWHTHTITEDVEFSIRNILAGRRVSFCVDAVCYDEQPYQLKAMFSQIERWCTGGYQVLRDNFKNLISGKSGVRFVQRFDVLMLLLMGPCSWISAIISWINRVIMLYNLPLFFFMPSALFSVFSTICIYIGVAGVLKYNHISRRIIGLFSIITFPLFLFFYMLCSIKACFFPSKKWVKVEHQALSTKQ